jgi:hypothetical protein
LRPYQHARESQAIRLFRQEDVVVDTLDLASGKMTERCGDPCKLAADDEVDVDDAVFDEGGTVVWAVDLIYKGKNTWAATNAVQIRGPKPTPYPRDPESEWTFDHEWRLEKGNLYDVKSGHRCMCLAQWGQLSGPAAQ